MSELETRISFHESPLTRGEQKLVSAGFEQHSLINNVPQYLKRSIKWLAQDDHDALQGVATCNVLWDWLYIDELWVSEASRGQGLGKLLMERIERYAASCRLQGIWLWTQSWQAEHFYRQLGYCEFTRFDDFPIGHTRIGFRKRLAVRGADG
ncbi:MAG: GNAT family N-acetyltransferase [Pseudomonadota bacterium]